MACPSSPCFKSIMSRSARKLPPSFSVPQGNEGHSQMLTCPAGGRLTSSRHRGSPWKKESVNISLYLSDLSFPHIPPSKWWVWTVSSRSYLYIFINHQERRMREGKKETREVEEQEERKKRKGGGKKRN